MSIKRRLSLLISVLLSILFICGAFTVEFLYSEFRKDEFKRRLEEKALTYVKLLIDVKEVDSTLLRIIDRNTVGKLYDEKVVIFDQNWRNIYHSPKYEDFAISTLEKSRLEKSKKIYRDEKEIETIGIEYVTGGTKYYVIVEANDQYGKRSLEYLILLLIFSTIILSVSGWFLATFMVNRVLKPMKLLHEKVSEINEGDLHERILVKPNSKNEIDLLSKEFNLLLGRIEKAYQRQKMFTSHASHELKTPISRIVLQLENLMKQVNAEQEDRVKDIIKQTIDINRLIDSLLILAKIEDRNSTEFKNDRIDELIFSVIEEIKLEFMDCKIEFEIEENPRIYESLDILMNHSILKIALLNLFRNAYSYSDSKLIQLRLYVYKNQLRLSVINDGHCLDDEDQGLIFQQFGRGKNSNSKPGNGLGLVIVRRIIDHHCFQIHYSVVNGLNQFTVSF
jgi:signal transduction histidine kinase